MNCKLLIPLISWAFASFCSSSHAKAAVFLPLTVSVDTNALPNSSTEIIMGTFSLDEKGLLMGSYVSMFGGLAKNQMSERYPNGIDVSQFEPRMMPFENVHVDSISMVKPIVQEQPLKRLIYCKIPLQMTQIGYMHSVQLPIYADFLISPFNQIPNNEGYMLKTSYKNQFSLTITLPDEYTFEAKPDNLNLVLEDSQNRIQFLSNIVGSRLQIIFKYQMGAGFYTNENFLQLKQAIEKIINKKNETIIIRKKMNWAGK
jgi:hypothetical protein